MDLFELSAILRLNTKSYEKSLQDAEAKGRAADSRLNKIFGGIGKAAKIAGATMVAVAGAGVGAAATMVKGAVSEYAKYEQLVGGMETLFKKDASLVIQNAKNAYKTAGVSANQYMELATSFASSLLQSVGKDTNKARVLTDQAIIDMSDNVNKMGTSMEAVENAYRGFAKGNFTMLDNLQLGYGGTKKEMERLLKDAEKLTGKKFDVSNFGDIVEAIHAIQTEMGITGTTAKEAQTTISGSFGMMKASWANLLTTLGDRKGVHYLKRRTKEFADSAKTYIKNLVPVINNALTGIGTVVDELAPIISKELPGIVSKALPILLRAGLTIGKALAQGIGSVVKKTDWKKMFRGAEQKIRYALGNLFGMRGIDSTWSGIAKAAVDKLKEGFQKAGNAIKVKLSELLHISSEDANWLNIGKAIISKIHDGIKQGAHTVKLKLGELLGISDESGTNLSTGENVRWIKIGSTLIAKVKEGIKNATTNAKLKLGELLGISNATGENLESGEEVKWREIGGHIIAKIKEGIRGGVTKARIKLGELLGISDSNGVDLSTGEGVRWARIGGELIRKIKDGFKSASTGVKIRLGELLGISDKDGLNLSDGEAVRWTRIGGELIRKIKDGIKNATTNAKLRLGKLLGISDDNGTNLETGEDARWIEIGKAVVRKIKEGAENLGDDAKIKLGQLLGISGSDGKMANGEEATWRTIGGELVDKIKFGIRNAVSKGKVRLANWLGITAGDGTKLTDASQTTWGNIGKNLLANIKTGITSGLGKTKNFLAKILGLTDDKGELADSASWGDIGKKILDSLFSVYQKSGSFLKKLILGDEYVAEDYFDREAKQLVKASTWSDVGDKIWGWISGALSDHDWISTFFEKGTEKVEGIINFIDNLIGGVTKWLTDNEHLQTFTNFFTTIISRSFSSLGKILEAVVPVITKALTDESVWNSIGDILESIFNGLLTLLDKAPSILEFVGKVAGKFIETLTSHDNLSKLFQGLINVVKELVTSSGDITHDLVQGLVNIIKHPDFWNAVVELLEAAFMKLPGALMEGIVSGLTDGIFGEGVFAEYDAKSHGLLSTIFKVLGGDLTALGNLGDAIPALYRDWSQGKGMYVTGARKEERTKAGIARTLRFEDTSGREISYDQLVGYKSKENGQGKITDGYAGAKTLAKLVSGVDIDETFAKEIDTLIGRTKTGGENRLYWATQLKLMLDALKGGYTGDVKDLMAYINEYTKQSGGQSFYKGIQQDFANLDIELQKEREMVIHVIYQSDFGTLPPWAQWRKDNNGQTAAAGGYFATGIGFDWVNGAKPNGKQAKGLWSVPYDDFTAQLHRDEMVLTASQAREYRSGMMGNSDAIVQAIQGLRADMTRLQLVVGEKTFGRTVVKYGGKRMNGYLGGMEDKLATGYGWG